VKVIKEQHKLAIASNRAHALGHDRVQAQAEIVSISQRSGENLRQADSQFRHQEGKFREQSSQVVPKV
jgi:hypothetical protein